MPSPDIIKRREYRRRYYEKNIEKYRTSAKAYRQKNVEMVREKDRQRSIRTRWGLSYEEYQKLLGYQCSLCPRQGKMFLDHNHQTGEIRGALCQACNNRLGHLEWMIRNPAWKYRALLYLKGDRVDGHTNS